jgi:steroid delta-isomerase-like uncharacterized protein
MGDTQGEQFVMRNLLLLFMGLPFLGISACTEIIDAAEKNRNLVERWFQVWNTGDLASIEEIVATDFVNHDLNHPEKTDFQSYRAWVAENRTAFPDFHVEVHDMIAEGDKVASRWTVTGTHKGNFLGVPPTSARVTVTGMNIHRLVDGKIVEAWWSYDMLGMMQQLGVISPMPDAPPALNRKPEDYSWSQSSEVIGDPGDPESNKDLVLREELEGWKQGNVGVALETIAPDFVNHDPIWPAVTDYESYIQWVESKLTGPLDLTVDDLIAEGDKVVGRCTVDTGGAIMESVIIFYRFADGRIVEKWWSKDVLVPLKQLGVVRPPDQN